ncbi:MAG: energy-coupled thiamine transporter ThiT [Vallitaleaceae bacterium]|jgi:thiamine transporter|nr:energy-coupled thiamine transporter ThiT [Vallitaleaceae bacterium]
MFQEFSDAISKGDISVVVTSTLGQVITWVVAIALLGIIFFMTARKNRAANGVRALTYSGVAIAIGTILSLITIYSFPQGGSVTALSMLAITTIGYIYGLRYGVICGFAYGLIQLIIQPYVVHPVQLLLDYPIAFGVLGLSGLFSSMKYGLQVGYLVAIIARLLVHTISGVVFFAEYAGSQNVVWYSLIYNGTYIGTEGVITLVLLATPFALLFKYIKKNALKS